MYLYLKFVATVSTNYTCTLNSIMLQSDNKFFSNEQLMDYLLESSAVGREYMVGTAVANKIIHWIQ